MALLEPLVGFVYEIVSNSWFFSTIAVKYILLIQLFDLIRRNGLNLSLFVEEVEKRSGETVTGIVLAGLITAFTGFKLEPLIPVIGQVVALAYFAFLFWRY